MNQAPATLSELLDLALELPEGERATWLESLPDTHAQLKPRLRALLARAAQVETSDFLVTLPKLGVLQPGGIAATEAPGDEIGPYRLVREIGARRHGLGVAGRAHRRHAQAPGGAQVPAHAACRGPDLRNGSRASATSSPR